MKQRLFLITLVILATLSAKAQKSIRIGYIDMEYILQNVPEYQEAQAQLDQRVGEWKKEIETRMSKVEEMKKTLENERVLLTPELIEERQDEIAYMENEVLDYQQKRFGPQGDLMLQRRNLVEPVQDQVFNAVQEISKARQYDFVFDKSADLVMLYANERHDISDQILLSITRASKRNQINNRADRKELERTEARSVEEEREVTQREEEAEAKKTERDSIISARQDAREAEKAAKEKEFEERRQRLLEERQQKRDSIIAARKKAAGITEEPAEAGLTPEEKRQKILEERQRRKDSIIEARTRRKDSLDNAKKNNGNLPPSGDPDGI
ncbi:MAG: hypothetical protein CL868_10115 [Cytophagaceae bacterium]|nr:hypothetical protein [Cytophagaceae bacterium]